MRELQVIFLCTNDLQLYGFNYYHLILMIYTKLYKVILFLTAIYSYFSL